MFTYKAFLILLILRLVKSEIDFKTVCRNDYRNMVNGQIDVLKYCSLNNCIEKCCGEGEMFNIASKCTKSNIIFNNLKKKFPKLYKDVDYSKIELYSWDGYNKQKSNKTFVFIRNRKDVQNCTTQHYAANEYFILEDGSIMMQDSETKEWWNLNRLEYCVDFKVVLVNKQLKVKLVVREYHAEPEDYKPSKFLLVGLLISSFFMVLVLVVYCLLSKLPNLIVMAYTFTILIMFFLKIFMVQSFASTTSRHCQVIYNRRNYEQTIFFNYGPQMRAMERIDAIVGFIIAPMLYFAAVSSFFWLKVMSFDVWWSLRGHRKRCEIKRRGERVKFMWYCLYAWGAPLLITAIVTTLDYIDLENRNIYKPPFNDCFINAVSVTYYFIIPIGVIMFVNIIFFLLTAYEIRMIKRVVQRCQDSRSIKQDVNRFATYIKLFVVIGVSWCLEFIPSHTVWVFILTSTYNLFIGVAIFFLFVFNKQIFIKLCKRFSIKNRFTKNLEASEQVEQP